MRRFVILAMATVAFTVPVNADAAPKKCKPVACLQKQINQLKKQVKELRENIIIVSEHSFTQGLRLDWYDYCTGSYLNVGLSFDSAVGPLYTTWVPFGNLYTFNITQDPVCLGENTPLTDTPEPGKQAQPLDNDLPERKLRH